MEKHKKVTQKKINSVFLLQRKNQNQKWNQKFELPDRPYSVSDI